MMKSNHVKIFIEIGLFSSNSNFNSYWTQEFLEKFSRHIVATKQILKICVKFFAGCSEWGYKIRKDWKIRN